MLYANKLLHYHSGMLFPLLHEMFYGWKISNLAKETGLHPSAADEFSSELPTGLLGLTTKAFSQRILFLQRSVQTNHSEDGEGFVALFEDVPAPIGSNSPKNGKAKKWCQICKPTQSNKAIVSVMNNLCLQNGHNESHPPFFSRTLQCWVVTQARSSFQVLRTPSTRFTWSFGEVHGLNPLLQTMQSPCMSICI